MILTTTEQLYDIFLRHRIICTDTRNISNSCLFFALKGQNFDGNEFALDAIKAGAAFAVVDNPNLDDHPNLLFVEDVLTTLQQLARHHRLTSNAKILAITGTNGKTTTKELIAHVLQTSFSIIYTKGNLNNHIGVPLTLLEIKDDTEIAIIEMGANHIGEIAAYCTWALPDFGLITNIGKAHLEGFGSLEGVKKAKGELYDFLSKNQHPIFRYQNDTNLSEIGLSLPNTITYGWDNADITAINRLEEKFATVEVISPDQLNGIYTSQLVGSYNAANILCAITVGNYFGISSEKIKTAIQNYLPQNQRSQFIETSSNKIILDAYNANPTSMNVAIDHFYHQNFENKILCIGGMKELGDDSDSEHKSLVDKIKKMNFEKVFLVGKEFENYHDSFYYFETSEKLREYFIENPLSNATILIKGSRGSKMEIILEAIQ